MKRPFLYYFSLLILIVGSIVVSLFLGKFLMKFFDLKPIYLELISKVILLLFLFIQYLLYIKFNKKEDEFFKVKYETSSYCYLEKKDGFTDDFYKGNRPIPLKVHILGLSLLFFYTSTIIGSNFQVLVYPLIKDIPFFKDSAIIYLKALSDLIKQNLILSFSLIVLIGPIVEELTFRGFSLSVKFEKFTKLIITVFFSFIFSIIHLDFSRVFSIFAMGFALGLIYNLTESLIYPILIHIINNGISFITLYSILQSPNLSIIKDIINSKLLKLEEKQQSIFSLIILTIVLVIFASYIFIKLKSVISEEDMTQN